MAKTPCGTQKRRFIPRFPRCCNRSARVIMTRMTTNSPSTQTPDQLQSRFSHPGVLFDQGHGGLTRLTLSGGKGQLQMYLHGSHVSHWQPTGHAPVLFMSQSSNYVPGKPIRGGVPICWPWFGPREGDSSAPMHGFARLQEWMLESIVADPARGLTVTTKLPPTELGKSLLPESYELSYIVAMGTSLRLTLRVRNTGTKPLTLRDALHTYFAVKDVRDISITGLENTTYISKVEGVTKTQAPEPIRFTSETDRVYVDTQSTCVLTDPKLSRRITVAKEGSNSTVVWNPWIDKSKIMPDFGDEEWPGMVCIETANALSNALTVAPGQTHETTQIVSVEKI